MILWLLDTVSFIQSIPLAFVMLLLLWAFIEGVILRLFRIRHFLTAILHALVVNLISMAVCFLLLYLSEQEDWVGYTSLELEASNLVAWLALYIITVILEGSLLKFMNAHAAWKRLAAAVLLMNLATFFVIYLYVQMNQ